MTNFNSEFRSKAAAVLAAFVLSTTFVTAAVGPAHAVEAPAAAARVAGQSVA